MGEPFAFPQGSVEKVTDEWIEDDLRQAKLDGWIAPHLLSRFGSYCWQCKANIVTFPRLGWYIEELPSGLLTARCNFCGKYNFFKSL